ncbi:MAG: alpha-amylase family glycosyl hydrolase, partial [Longimicrobiales bacterium]
MATNTEETATGAAARRRLPVGAEVVREGVHFRVWAPACRTVEVVLHSGEVHGLVAEPADDWFSGLVEGLGAGARYSYRLDGRGELLADPASRFQPDGPDGASEVIDPDAFAWSDDGWRGVQLAGRVICEIHIGTFTAAGRWAAATDRLPLLADAGIDLVEVMPVADFAGTFGWGYDGVDLFAPTRLYGRPDEMRRFIDHAHGHGIGVILDVVYNHLGPDGNVLPRFAGAYFSRDLETDWGAAVNFGGPDSGPVREFFLANVEYWMREFRLDGLRFDATQDIHDESPEHILTVMVRRARAATGGRAILLFGENEPQRVRLITPPERGGRGLDALWNDDLHHSAIVALTGCREAYYTDYFGSAQELVSAAKYGFLYQGQRYAWQEKRRGTPTRGLPRAAFVNFIENHDQLANSASGERIRLQTAPGQYRALTA